MDLTMDLVLVERNADANGTMVSAGDGSFIGKAVGSVQIDVCLSRTSPPGRSARVATLKALPRVQPASPEHAGCHVEDPILLLEGHRDLVVGAKRGWDARARSGKLFFMQAHKTRVVVQADHQVVLRLPEDFPAGEADIIVLPRSSATQEERSPADFDRFLAALPVAPVVTLASLDRSELYK